MASIDNYIPGMGRGATIVNADIAAGTITGASISSATITGANTTVTKFYGNVAVGSSANGSTVVPIFGSTAPTAGTITSFYVVGAGTAGSAVLWATTTGTLAAFHYAATVGTVTGTAVLNAGFASGDTVQAYNANTGQGTCTYFVTFVTAS